jgi:hypothetical protein
MAQIFTANVYQINDNQPLSTPQLQGFSPANVKFRPTPLNTDGSSTVQSVTGVNLYGIVQELPTGLNVNGVNFYVVETVTQLAAKANA